MLTIDVERRQGRFMVQAAIEQPEVGVTALFGPSGAGKTSIVNMVAGLMRPDRGHIRINGTPVFDSEQGLDLPPEKRRIGYVFQDGRLFPHLSVRANLTYGLRLSKKRSSWVGFDQVVDLLGIEHLLDRRPARLSGGEKQRVAIGRALLASPQLLLMDEPLASLDAYRKQEVLPFIQRMCREFRRPIIYVSHSMDEILKVASHLVILKAGRTVAAGPILDIMNRVDLETGVDAADCGALIDTVVEKNDNETGLTHLRFAAGVLKVFCKHVAPGDALRVRLPARSVAVALNRPDRVSIRNIFSGVINAIGTKARPYTLIRVDIGAPILAAITECSASELDLAVGKRVYVMIKTVSIHHDPLLSKSIEG